MELKNGNVTKLANNTIAYALAVMIGKAGYSMSSHPIKYFVSPRFVLIFSAAYAIVTPSATAYAKSSAIISTQALTAENLPSLTIDNSSPALAQPPSILDITSAVHRAVQWHPDISAEVGKLFSQVEQVSVAESKYYPQISGGFNNGITNTQTNRSYSPALVLSVSQMLYDFGNVASSVREANAAVAQQQAKVLISVDGIIRNTATALVQVQGYQKLVETARQQLDALDHIARLAGMRTEEGASSRSDIVQTQTRIEGAQATLTQYQASLNRWRASLATYLGWETVKKVNYNLPTELNKSCYINNIDNHPAPSVLAAWAQLNQATAQLDNANARMMPTISLEPEVTHYLNHHYANNHTQDRTQYSAWIRVKMPLYQGGGLSASRNAAQYSLNAAASAVKVAQLTARQQLHEARDEAEGLQQALLIQQRQQKLAEETRLLYQQQYLQLGTRPLLDVLNVEQEIYQTRFTQQQTEMRLHSLQLECLHSTGMIRNAFGLDRQQIQGVEVQP